MSDIKEKLTAEVQKINETILIEEKGSKERIVPINIYTKKALIDYLEVRNSLIKGISSGLNSYVSYKF